MFLMMVRIVTRENVIVNSLSASFSLISHESYH